MSIEDLPDFPWTSYGALVGARPAILGHAVELARLPLGGDPTRAAATLRQLTVDRVAEMAARRDSQDADVLDVLREAARRHHVTMEEIEQGTRSTNARRAREEASRLARARGVPVQRIARTLGITTRAVRRLLIKAA